MNVDRVAQIKARLQALNDAEDVYKAHDARMDILHMAIEDIEMLVDTLDYLQAKRLEDARWIYDQNMRILDLRAECETANILLNKAHRELSAIDAITVSPTGVDELVVLLEQMRTHLQDWEPMPVAVIEERTP